MTDFVAVDGEAISSGEYVLMRDSTGRKLLNERGLTTSQVFKWLLDLDTGIESRRKEYVCFGLNYDVNQWLVSLTPGVLRTLLDEEEIVLWGRYQLSWIPTKCFELHDLQSGRRIKICEVFGFFQSSFVKALEKWGFEAPSRMKSMKGARNDFSKQDLTKMLAYCYEECQYLVQLMDKLADACERANVTPAHNWWIGAGSIANALMRVNHVKNFLVHDTELADRETVENYILRAYFGGRVELFTMGCFPTVRTRDIRSAYPYATTFLPNLNGAELRQVRGSQLLSVSGQLAIAPHGIWHVTWENQTHGKLAPFPARTSGASIVYPISGEGCYHTIELQTALLLGYRFTVQDGYVLENAVGTKPFDFIRSVYAERSRLKKKGDAAEKALKLGMNSVYGKLAQGYGRVSASGHVFPPPYQSYFWAGEITARTRARALELAHRSTNPIMIATDGVFSESTPVRGSSSGKLGTLDAGVLEDALFISAGVYRGTKDGEQFTKSRGFFAKDVDYDELEKIWIRENVEGQYVYNSRRFIGARVALARNKPELWRTWQSERRSITLHPDPWRKTWGSVSDKRLDLYPLNKYIESMPYKPKTAMYDLSADIDEIESMIGDDQPDFPYSD